MSTTIAVAGAGPLGAATAYHLARRGASVTIVADDRPDAAFRSSGGSICWHRPDRRLAALVRETADHIRAAVDAGAAIRCRSVPYLFLAQGVHAPALNVASEDVVRHLLDEAERAGAQRADVGAITSVQRHADGYTLAGAAGTVTADVVVLALGLGNGDLMTGLDPRREKRQLFVLDLPVDDARADWPHTIASIGPGHAYVFVKELDEGLRVLVGQEDLVADDDLTGPVDHFGELLDSGVGDVFAFLRDAAVERVLWGVDWDGKLPHIATDGAGLLSVNCGSAVRVCVGAGRLTADAALNRLT